MEKHYNDVALIEDFLGGRLSAAEKAAFEAQLASDPNLQREVAAYKKLFSGFQGLRDEHFAVQVAAWANAAKASGANPAKTVGIGSAPKVRSLYQRLAWAAGFLVLFGAAAMWMQSQRYTDEALLQDAYVAPKSEATMGGEAKEAGGAAQKQFEEAHQRYQAGDFGAAADRFAETLHLLEQNPDGMDKLSLQFYLENTRWTLLLANFAAGRIPEADFVAGLETFANDPASEYAQKAKDLTDGMRSFWRW